MRKKGPKPPLSATERSRRRRETLAQLGARRVAFTLHPDALIVLEALKKQYGTQDRAINNLLIHRKP